MAPDKSADTSGQHPHSDAQLLCFGGAGNDIAVIVGKHDERFSRQLRLKNLFAGCIKIIAVNQGNHSFFKVQLTTPQTEKSISGVILIAG